MDDVACYVAHFYNGVFTQFKELKGIDDYEKNTEYIYTVVKEKLENKETDIELIGNNKDIADIHQLLQQKISAEIYLPANPGEIILKGLNIIIQNNLVDIQKEY